MTTAVPIEIHQAIHDATTAGADELITTSRAIHALAEIGFEEVESSRLLSAVIEAAWISGRPRCLGDAHRIRGAARQRGSACCVRLRIRRAARSRTRMRAQPHRDIVCGRRHRTRAIARRAWRYARVSIVGAPAEEGGGGKIPLCHDGLFDDCDAVLIFHPSDRTASVQYALACTHWEWTFRGKAAHAAGHPDHGINALDAFVHAYNGVSLWRQQLRDDARVHGFIVEGGTAPNIIPELTRGEYLTRARDGEYLRTMNVRFRAIFEAAAQRDRLRTAP